MTKTKAKSKTNLWHMIFGLCILLLLSAVAVASPSPFPICPFNKFGKYYVVFDLRLSPNQPNRGMRFALYAQACASYNLLPANVTASIIPDLVDLLLDCYPVPIGQQSLWIDYYEGLPNPYACNSMLVDGSMWTAPYQCPNVSMPALCEVPVVPVEITSTIVTANQTVTEDVTSLLTTVFLSTETVIDYFVTRITSVITQGTSTLTTITTTSTLCSTITRTHTSSYKPTRTRTSSSSSSSKQGGKEPTNLKNVQQFSECTSFLNGFHFVRGDLPFSISGYTPAEACGYFGYVVANITLPILDNLAQVMDDCFGIDPTSFIFDSYYGWTPLCGFVFHFSDNTPGININDFNYSVCDINLWVLCNEGSPIITTSTVPTGPFTTSTISLTRTELETVTETAEISETITESDILTVTSTSLFSTTSTTRLTVPTTTVTLTSMSLTSCCCNPVICTTIEQCCKPKPTCDKPHRHH